jgi:pyruvate, water dikinase
MKGLRGLVTSWVTPRKRIHRISVKEKFAHFRTIGAANDAFLRQLASLQEQLNASNFLELNLVAAEAKALSGHIRSMVEALVAMTGDQFESLLEHYESLDRQVERQLHKAHPTGSGPLIVWPTDAEALQPGIVGPKAARLAEVALNAGLKVPPFFSISVYGYRHFMEASGIGDVIHRMRGSCDFRQNLSIKSFCDAVNRAFAEASFPQVLEAELLAGYRKLVASSPNISGAAVRSSAAVEDGESSFAGQFESILNVCESDLVKAYKEVVASKYRREALKYAIARGYGDEDIDMPVLIMAMVQPSASGVAFSRCPDRPDRVMVTAVPGLAQAADSGKAIPDTYFVQIEDPVHVEVLPGKWKSSLHCAAGGGLVEFNENALSPQAPALQEEAACAVARAAIALEHHFGSPQDVEWAFDKAGTLIVIQTRPLYISSSKMTPQASAPAVEGYRILERGIRAAGGAAFGKVHHLLDLQAIETVPEGSILCVPTTSPRLAEVMGTVRGIIAAAGSPTGHMATVAREFEIPCLVGAENAFVNLPEGTPVTVDGNAGIVYEGEVKELLSNARAAAVAGLQNPTHENLQQLLAGVAPLTLTEPDTPAFSPDNCQTLHDVARFVHQKSIMEMFNLEDISPQERHAAHRLLWRAPMEVLLLDLGGGIAECADRRVPVEQIKSAALLALIEGMTDPRLRWAGPVGFDLKGFMSVVVRSAADDQRYGEPIYCLCAQDYVHFASRLAYHFATVDAICGQSINENYARFLFFGGAAVAARREWRAHLLATVLRFNGFVVKQQGDRVEAMLAKRHAEQIEEALVMLGRLMMASRHLDMVIESQAAAQELAQAFLSGDYAFEHIRRTGIQS